MITIDLRNTIISFALLNISNSFKEMRENEIMEILGRDSTTRSALFRIIPESSYSILCDERVDNSNQAFRIQLQKMA